MHISIGITCAVFIACVFISCCCNHSATPSCMLPITSHISCSVIHAKAVPKPHLPHFTIYFAVSLSWQYLLRYPCLTISPSKIFVPFLSVSPVYCPTVVGSTPYVNLLPWFMSNSTINTFVIFPKQSRSRYKSPSTHSPLSIRFPPDPTFLGVIMTKWSLIFKSLYKN